MSDLARRLEQARDHIHLGWSPERAEHNRRALLRRKGLRTAGRAAIAALLVLGLGLAAGKARLSGGEAPSLQALATAGPPGPAATVAPGAPGRAVPAVPRWTRAGAQLRFRDGSRATLLSTDTSLSAGEDAPGRTVVKLDGGGVRFDVVHDPSRVFRVEAHEAAVEVLGTRFSMERAGYGLRVAVEHGRVRVLWDGGATELTDGQSGVFPGERAAAPAEAPGEDKDGPGEPARPPIPQRRHESSGRAPAGPIPQGPDWRALAQEGQFERAYRALERGSLTEVSDEPGDLLILADVARLSRHPAQAVAPLSKVVDAHPRDPRAPLAAFTLGRVLLDDLGRPQQAAAAFAQAQGLDPTGPLAEDALAREVEAWSRAGDLGRARGRAREYLKRYPDGRRHRSVRRYGDLD